ncbi:hypothetical protein AAG570_000261 [Ranatra chinensis]|uniref:Uncharacterized protein n=1 Tax=Ranatra chinensis TaxID=642074 RepID=A0ABD0YYP3_9HEMI
MASKRQNMFYENKEQETTEIVIHGSTGVSPRANHGANVFLICEKGSRDGSRKRRPSTGQDENKEDLMDECTAALVLMRLSCSPHSPNSVAPGTHFQYPMG